jgi:hypothetical protein
MYIAELEANFIASIGDDRMVYLFKDLVLFYPFNGANFNDFSGFNNHGTKVYPDNYPYHGGDWDIGRPCNSRNRSYGNGNGTYTFDIQHSGNGFPLGLTPRSLSAWVYLTGSSSLCPIIYYGKGDDAENGPRTWLFAQGNNKNISFLGGTSGGLTQGITSGNNVFEYNEWSLISAVFDGSLGSIYCNGSLIVGPTSVGNTSAWNIPSSGNTFGVLGFYNAIFNNLQYAKGTEIMVWRRALSSAEIQMLYSLRKGKWIT